MVQTILGIVAIGLFVGTTAFAQGHGVCTHEDAIEADKGLDSLSDWRHVYEPLKYYSHCDNGARAEGSSDKIASLLVNHCDSVEKLLHLWRLYPELVRFVLGHEG